MSSLFSAALVSLLGELNDLKRVRIAGRDGSLAEQFFRQAWAQLVTGVSPAQVALPLAAQAVAASRLAGIDRGVLTQGGLSPAEATAVLEFSFDSVSAALHEQNRFPLRGALAGAGETLGAPPAFVSLLCAQPRAGATRPDRPRLILVPTESHGDHCGMVAIYTVLLAPFFGANHETPLLAALAHHLHNAGMPDAGFTGEELLGPHLGTVMQTFRAAAAEELPPRLRQAALAAIPLTTHADTPEARTFQAADVFDRVLQMRWHAQAAGFTLDQALHEMELVHAGPVQAFQLSLLWEAGLC